MSAADSFIDQLKPRYPEAVTRLRNSLIALVFLTITTYLLPTPSLPVSFYKFTWSHYTSSFDKGIVMAEMALLTILVANILQSSWGVYYPRPLAAKPPPSPAHTIKRVSDETTPNWRRAANGLSPNTTPQRQRPFAMPTTSDPRGLATSYSLPFISPSPADTSLNSSTISFPPSPSPLASIRGRPSSRPSGRALDESVLSRLADETQEEED